MGYCGHEAQGDIVSGLPAGAGKRKGRMVWLLFVTAVVAAIIYMVRFYRLKAALKKAAGELAAIEENPEDNRILLLAFPDKELEELLKAFNRYVLLTRKERICYQNREKALRAQIENISHDLRTPLTAIIGYLELLDTDKLSAEDVAAVERVSKKAKNLQGLIGNFYDLSRLEMNDYHLCMEKLDIVHFAKEASLLFYQELEKGKSPCGLTHQRIPCIFWLIQGQWNVFSTICCKMPCAMRRAVFTLVFWRKRIKSILCLETIPRH